MSDTTYSFERALVFLEQAQEALANAASELRETTDLELIDSAIRLEAETCILSVHVQRAMRKSRSRRTLTSVASDCRSSLPLKHPDMPMFHATVASDARAERAVE